MAWHYGVYSVQTRPCSSQLVDRGPWALDRSNVAVNSVTGANVANFDDELNYAWTVATTRASTSPREQRAVAGAKAVPLGLPMSEWLLFRADHPVNP